MRITERSLLRLRSILSGDFSRSLFLMNSDSSKYSIAWNHLLFVFHKGQTESPQRYCVILLRFCLICVWILLGNSSSYNQSFWNRNKSKGYKYSGSDNVNDVAWYISNSRNKMQGVGQKMCNELGLCDMVRKRMGVVQWLVQLCDVLTCGVSLQQLAHSHVQRPGFSYYKDGALITL